ncbi:hypothetical protein BFP70_18035 [Thioclava sp. SK-1]|uniref:hypothetical protein n=1 Tax=Thioclava sp. SK-1 TaxID=1889770 RepID=UPI000826B1DF|nr:hypothetical protein [Thioclava sp. SK-1]OCX59998.1 hypothetical protein BFP70_18035 [Thioclava sp. SK-1]
MAATLHRNEPVLPNWVVWGLGPGAIVTVIGLFYLVWNNQFAAPAAYLFNTPTQEVEAGYCLAAFQQVQTGVSGAGNFISEGQQFWIKRLGSFDSDFSKSAVSGRAALGRDLQKIQGREREWIREVVVQCGDKSLNYGAKYSSFD